MPLIYNKYKNRLEITNNKKLEFYKQDIEELKTLYKDFNRVEIDNSLVYNISTSYIPNLDTVSRRFIDKVGNVLIDNISTRNSNIIYPISKFTVGNSLEFDDLSGVTIVSYSGDQTLLIVGNEILSNTDAEVHSLLLSNGYFLPLPHLGYGFDSNGDLVQVTSTIEESYSEIGTSHLIDKGCVYVGSDILPNNNDGEPITDTYDTLVEGTSFINNTPFKIRLFTSGDLDTEYKFFDKSDVLIWGPDIRLSEYYDISNPGVWHSFELTSTEYLHERVLDGYDNKLWVKGQFLDIFLYNVSLEGDDLLTAARYCGSLFPYQVVEGDYEIIEGIYYVRQ